PPMNWGGDSDFFYHSTYGPAIKNTDGLRRALYGPVARLTEERPRFTHIVVQFWDHREAWEKARKRVGGSPPLPRASQGLETYAGDLTEVPPEGSLSEQGTLAVVLFSFAPGAGEDIAGYFSGTYAPQMRSLPGLRQYFTGAAEVAETSGTAPRSRISLLDFENHDAATPNAARPGAAPAVRPIREWATGVEAHYFDVQELVRK
ncbi:MAG: hypothetical protein NTZ05_20055, partial [Chloroflexi bacterium]|nr:hypothetical protein [Chloroflexota bacterium]